MIQDKNEENSSGSDDNSGSYDVPSIDTGTPIEKPRKPEDLREK